MDLYTSPIPFSKLMTINLPGLYVGVIDRLIQEKKVKNRSCFLRDAVTFFLAKEEIYIAQLTKESKKDEHFIRK